MNPFDALVRHFADLRDGTHGTATDRAGKETLFAAAVRHLDPVAAGVLEEVNRHLLLGTGEIAATGLRSDPGGLIAQWTVSWPEQRATGLPPLALIAHYGQGFHHPHLRGVTVKDWPFNVFSAEDAATQAPTLFQRDFRIVPVTARGRSEIHS
ncbi:hypothetical protein [Actinoplanes sp. NPDC089786]|uniref:hypothetical protein n=1 Tax=Actinoplanes sp. NPDC089786 TaxID=3155185 RepID=UPI0034191475